MKTKLLFSVTVILITSTFLLTGCPEIPKGDDDFPYELVGTWSNKPENLRTFTINEDGAFTATLSPYTDQPGTVTGRLTKEEGNTYLLSDMVEITGAVWGGAVGMYNGSYAEIKLYEKNMRFVMDSDNPAVQAFFGGTYHRQ